MNSKKVAFLGIAIALVFVATQIKIPVPITQGYVNLGDGVILICSYLAGPFAAIPGAVGSALADLTAGYSQYALPTFIIKGLVALVSSLILKTSAAEPSFIKKLLAFIAAELFMAGGYLAFESLPFMYGFKAAILSFPFNLIQGACAVIIGMAVTSPKTIKFNSFR